MGINFEWVQLLTKDPVTLGLAIAVVLLSIAALILLFWKRKPSNVSRSWDNEQLRNQKEIHQNSPEVQPKQAPVAITGFGEQGVGNTKSWKGHSLFGSSFGGKEEHLPKLDPTEIPTNDKSDRLFGSVTGMFASLLPESKTKQNEVKKELKHAGYYNAHAWQNLSALRYLGIIVPLIALGVLLLFVPTRLEPFIIGAMIVLPIMGWALPRLMVRSQAAGRLSEIEHGMPDMIDMLNMCVSQGLGLLPSLKRVGSELTHIHPALSQELKIVGQQAEIGTLDQALHNFNDRVDVPEVHSFTTLLTQTERMGTSVSSSLEEYSDNMRESLKQRADQKANTAAFKILFPTALCLMPAVFLFLLGPSIVELSDFFTSGSDVLNNTTDQFQSIAPRES